MNSITNLSAKELRKAANIKDKIASLQKELSKLLGSTVAAPTSVSKKGRKMSAAGRRNIILAQKKRWAKKKGAGKKSSK